MIESATRLSGFAIRNVTPKTGAWRVSLLETVHSREIK
jgi:hypothetical protein